MDEARQKFVFVTGPYSGKTKQEEEAKHSESHRYRANRFPKLSAPTYLMRSAIGQHISGHISYFGDAILILKC